VALTAVLVHRVYERLGEVGSDRALRVGWPTSWPDTVRIRSAAAITTASCSILMAALDSPYRPVTSLDVEADSWTGGQPGRYDCVTLFLEWRAPYSPAGVPADPPVPAVGWVADG